jgi:hypothetical protein
MEITLRKADALFKQALVTAKGLLKNGTVKVSIYEKRPVENIIEEQNQLAMERLELATVLLGVAFRIREAAGRANAEIGIDRLLRQRKRLEVEESFVAAVVGQRDETTRYVSPDDIDEMVDTLRAQAHKTERGGYGLREVIDVDVLNRDDVVKLQQRLTQLRLAKRGLDDELLSGNQHRIKLADKDVEVLRTHGLVA